MLVSNEDSLKMYNDYIEAKANVANAYVVNVANPLTQLDAVTTIDALNGNKTFRERAALCLRLLRGNHITVSLFGAVVADAQVTDAYSFEFDDGFRKDPLALEFTVAVIYGMFLKNCVPQLNGSQIAEKEKSLQRRSTPQVQAE